MNRMRRKVKAMYTNNKVLFENYAFMSILNVFTLLLPLITYPYLIGILGDYIYGSIIFAFTIITYFAVIADYGFGISAVKYVAEFKNNKERLNEIVTSVFLTRIVLCFILFLFLILGLYLFKVADKLLYILFYGYCLGDILFPSWFFQGIERLKYITYFNVICKLIFSALIFVFIHTVQDYLYYPVLYSLGSIGGALYGCYVMFFKYNIKIILPSQRMIKYRFRNSTSIFFSRIADILIVRTNVIMLGYFLGMKEVAYYDLANKLVKLASYPIMILNQVIYPKIASERDFLFMRRVFKYSFGVVMFIWVCFILSVPFWVDVLGKGEMMPAVQIAYILSPVIIIESMVYLQGSPTLVAAGYFKEFNNSMWGSFIVYFIGLGIVCLLPKDYSLYYVLFLQILSSFTLFIIRWYYIHKFEILRS